MSKVMFVATIGVVIVLLGGAGFALEPPDKRPGADQPILPLSPKLRGALVAEMAGLREGVADLSVSLTTGEWDKAAARARRIRDSYIMKQKLSPAELEELHRALPEEFVVLDERFHRHAEALARAASTHDAELALFYFGKMTEGCVACHARFATHALKGFQPPASPHAH